MKSPFRALLWEQSRVAGVLSLWIIGLRFLLLPCFIFLHVIDFYDMEQLNFLFVLSLLLVYSLCLVYRRDTHGHLTGGFEKRLMRLPLRTPLLVLTIFYIRFFSLCITAATFFFFDKLLFGFNVPYTDFIGVLELYLIFQTVDWIRHAIRGLFWIPLLFLVALIFIPTLNWEEGEFGVFLGTLTQEIVSPGFLLFALLAATLLSCLGVHILRRGACYGIPGPLLLIQQLREMGKARTQAFSSPAEALLWYEWKRHGWKLPVRMLFVCVLLYLLCFAFWYPPEEQEDALFTLDFFVYTAPLIALLLVTPFTGWLTTGFRSVLKYPQSQFPAMHPVTPLDHTWATWLTALKSLLLATGLAGCLSLIGTIVFTPSNIHLLLTTLQEGESSLLEVIMISTAPLLVVFALAWMLYFKETMVFILLCMLSSHFYIPDHPSEEMTLYTCQGILLLSGILAYPLLTWHRKQVSWRWTVSLLLLWALLSQQVFSISRDMPFSNRFSLVVVGYIGLIFIPFFASALHVPATVSCQDKKMWHREFRRPGFLLPITIVLLCLGLSFFVLSQPPTAHIKLKEEGYPLTFEELEAFYEAVPEEENAALCYLEAAKKLKTLVRQLEKKLPIVGDAEISGSTEAIFSEEMRTVIQHYLEENQQTRALLRKAQTYPESRYPLNCFKYWHGLTPALVKGGQLSDLLVVEALWWTLNNQPQKVLDSLQALHHLAQSFKSQPTYYAQETRIEILKKINTTTYYLLLHKPLSDSTLSALQQLVGSSETPPKYFVRALKGQVALTIENYQRSLTNNNGAYLFFFRLTGAERFSQAEATHQTRKIIQSYQKSMESVRILEHSIPYREEESIVEAQTIPTGFYFIGEIMTDQNLVQTALAIERFERAEKRLPTQLTELVPKYLEAIPWDYLGNAPVQYRQTENGYLVYGAGRDGEDDKAVWSRKYDQYLDQIFRVERAVDKENDATLLSGNEEFRS